jgi:hypothetical protein
MSQVDFYTFCNVSFWGPQKLSNDIFRLEIAFW